MPSLAGRGQFQADDLPVVVEFGCELGVVGEEKPDGEHSLRTSGAIVSSVSRSVFGNELIEPVAETDTGARSSCRNRAIARDADLIDRLDLRIDFAIRRHLDLKVSLVPTVC